MIRQPIATLSDEGELGSVPDPGIADLVSHAERHGGHMVVETAIALGYEGEPLERLAVAVEVADANFAERHGKYRARPKGTAAKRLERMVAEHRREVERAFGKVDETCS